MDHQFEEVITSVERVHEILGRPSHRIANKEIDHIDDICRRFIAASTFVVVGTRGADGLMDLSPKGDPAGSVAVLDPKTLAIAERPGNRRADTFENLMANPEIGLFFLIPGYPYTLRVAGKGKVVRDSALSERLATKGHSPKLVLVVRVEEAFTHCAKCIARGSLWQPEGWPDIAAMPTLGEATVLHGQLKETVAEMQAIIDRDFETNMY